MIATHPETKDVRTRRAILNLLKQNGPTDSASLASQLDVTAMAVRQHLYDLQKERIVTWHEEPRPMGRPAKLWKLTSEANRIFPDAHAELTVNLIDAVGQTFGEDGFKKLLQVRKQKQIDVYRKRMGRESVLKRRLETLARIRTEEGYMAEVKREKDGSFLFIENHCPICSAAKACTGLCESELEVFRAILGSDVAVKRTEHILAGARRCAYAVLPLKKNSLGTG